ncbi:DUF4817 domain-containing protein [Trichonephila clavipes]|nr:DUF4817 domain-containing protein [Trichonephila clavipes]
MEEEPHHQEVLNVAVNSFKIFVSYSQLSSMAAKYPGETAPNASTITHLVQRFRAPELMVKMKQSGRASIVKPKVADVDTALQRSPMKRPSVHVNIINGIHILAEQ